MSYEYLIPRLHGSPWDIPGAGKYSLDLALPRVSIYCPHPAPERPWLVGSFEHPDLPEQPAGARYWSWNLTYPTGDGYMIRLSRKGAGVSNVQYLAGNAVRDRQGETDRLKQAISSGDMDAATLVSKEIESADAVTRARIPMKCGTCGFGRAFRMENLHPIVSMLWQFGLREIPLRLFAARVDRRGQEE